MENSGLVEKGGGLLNLLLLKAGDIESNPGPPRRARAAPSAPEKKEIPVTPEGGPNYLDHKSYDCCEFTQALLNFDTNLDIVREYEDKISKLEKNMELQRKEIETLKATIQDFNGINDKIVHMNAKIEAITGVYDDLHEKMHEIDKTRRNNLLFYGIKPDFLPEIQSQLEQKIHDIIKQNFQISRDVPLVKISRMISGPEVRGCRPVLVNFVHWKDREEILRKSNFLRGSNVFVSEDLSKKMREHRAELHKYARQIRTKSPNKKCVIRNDKLLIDNHMYVYDEDKQEVVRFGRPTSPPRSNSRNNYSEVDEGLRRSVSVHSVNYESNGITESQGSVSPRTIQSSSASSMQERKSKFASVESLHVNPENTHETGNTTLQNGQIGSNDEENKEKDVNEDQKANELLRKVMREKRVKLKEGTSEMVEENSKEFKVEDKK